VQEASAKALLVDRDALRESQEAGAVLGAHGVLMDAYNTDVHRQRTMLPSILALQAAVWSSVWCVARSSMWRSWRGSGTGP
jgi:L-rhamnose isomerase